MKQNLGKIKINLVASRLNLSRNTVSKTLNGKAGVSEKTKKLIFDFINNEYEEIINENQKEITSNHSRTIMFSYRLENIEYINGLLRGIEKTLKNSGFLLAINILDSSPATAVSLPSSVHNGTVYGIISFNIYDTSYWNEVISIGIPSVFFDTQYEKYLFAGQTDIICSENENSIHNVIKILHKNGRSNFGFIGDPHYCGSLYQRWIAFQESLNELDLPLIHDNCILDNLSNYKDIESIQIIKKHISDLSSLPDAYICASDRQAILLLGALNDMSVRVPEDIAIVGFDNLPETLRQSPPLSTIEAYSEEQGELAVKKLLERLNNPNKLHEYIQCETKLILRESTGHSST